MGRVTRGTNYEAGQVFSGTNFLCFLIFLQHDCMCTIQKMVSDKSGNHPGQEGPVPRISITGVLDEA